MSIASQPPTLYGYQVHKIEEALIVFHAVYLGILNMVSRRLDTEERRHIQPGCIYVWEERGQGPETTGVGIERWTDSISWGPSRVRDEFLYYQERRTPIHDHIEFSSDSDTATYAHCLLLRLRALSENFGYLTQEEQPHLYTVWDHPQLSRIRVPAGMYRSARTPRRSSRTQQARLEATLRVAMANIENEQQETISEERPMLPNRNANVHPVLAPLEFLTTLCPPRRHIIDEMALMQVSFNRDQRTSSHL
ncbi:hypothetical protein CVT24_003857 [Panaeolus cyanescens]|uniref:Gti1/Pac2 family-domain-containing protein n=1 Tax=Panaeolus cyanescens TaxID=181874 RepID=A0A409W887_9AGAR|nr:hypothetical protein CVT24_003857 [Panaeolus cyanescens]